MKKTMRKSALLSSVAMLIVSAIVLTSATYAWFSASKDVSVAEINSSVTVSEGLLISSTGTAGSWTTNLTPPAGSYPTAAWVPVSTDGVASNNALTFVKGAVEDDVLTLASATAGTDFAKYELYVQGPASKEVRLHLDSEGNTVDPFDGTADGAASVLKFALYDWETGKFLNEGVVAADGSTGTYEGTSSTTHAGTTGDAYVVAGTTITEKALSNYTFTLPATAGQAKHFTVYVWVEGNDKDCTNSTVMGSEAIKFNLQMSIDANA